MYCVAQYSSDQIPRITNTVHPKFIRSRRAFDEETFRFNSQSHLRVKFRVKFNLTSPLGVRNESNRTDEFPKGRSNEWDDPILDTRLLSFQIARSNRIRKFSNRVDLSFFCSLAKRKPSIRKKKKKYEGRGK